MSKNLNHYNWDLILSELRAAAGSLDCMIEMIEARSDPEKAAAARLYRRGNFRKFGEKGREEHLRERFEVEFRHAQHHMNFAWNIRAIDPEKYTHLSREHFEKWGRFPVGLDSLVEMKSDG